MNKKIISKLKIEKPSYYDCTKNEVGIIQKLYFERILKDFYRRGISIGSISGLFTTSLSSLIALLTASSFNNFLNLEVSAWKAIFILIFVLS